MTTARTRPRTTAVFAVLFAMGLLSACGDDDAHRLAGTNSAVGTSDGPTTTTTSGKDDAGSCPDAGAVSEAIGVDVVADTNAPVQTDGFCPYVAMDDPGSLSVTITFTPMDITKDTDGGEAVAGVGQAARWQPVTEELSVWTGDEGVIVMVSPFGIDLDSRQAAIGLANLITRRWRSRCSLRLRFRANARRHRASLSDHSTIGVLPAWRRTHRMARSHPVSKVPVEAR